jgi:subtilisin family serine protease
MKIILTIFIVLFLSNCGSSSSDEVVDTNETIDENVTKPPVSTKDEPYQYQQWYMEYNSTFFTQNNIDQDAHIHADDYMDTYTGFGVKIAIIDDGLDVTHEELQGAIYKTWNVTNNSSDVSHKDTHDFHGTATTGIIASQINSKGLRGIAPDAQIIFLQYDQYGTDADTIEMFKKAEEFGADIISNSWGTYNVSPAVKDTIVDLSKNGRDGKGIIIVFASGNDDIDMGNDESAIPEVVAVGATDRENLRTYYSNFGDNLDIMAPGGYDLGITTIDDVGIAGMNRGDYILYNDSSNFIGTSASAPIISGLIALMLEKNPNLTREEVDKLLKDNADKIGHVPYDDEGRNNYYGYGKINLSRIMSNL